MAQKMCVVVFPRTQWSNSSVSSDRSITASAPDAAVGLRESLAEEAAGATGDLPSPQKVVAIQFCAHSSSRKENGHRVSRLARREVTRREERSGAERFDTFVSSARSEPEKLKVGR